MIKYLTCICLLFIVGCASNEEKPKEKTYSPETNRAFEMIERGGSYYLKKAPSNDVPAPQISTPPVTRRAPEKRVPREVREITPSRQEEKEIVIDSIASSPSATPDPIPEPTQVIEPEETVVTPPPPPPPPAPPVNAKVDERLVEINQNLAFYCMKHRKDPIYGGDEAKCMSFVNKTMSNCQKQHRIVNSLLLKCIKNGLKKRK